MSRRALPFFIGRRYAAYGSASALTGFISRLSIIGLAVGVAILVTTLSIMNGFDRELREKVLALLPHITATTLPGYPLQSIEQWQQTALQVEQLPGVLGSAPLVSLQGMVIANGQAKGVVISGVEPAAEQQISILDQFTENGSLSTLEQGAFNMIIGSGLAANMNLNVGDQLMLVSSELPVTLLGARPSRKRFTVAGIFTIGSELDSSLVYTNLNDAARLYRLGSGIHGLRVQLDDLFQVAQTETQLRPLMTDTTRISNWSYEFGAVYENIRISKTLVGLLLMMLIVVAAFNVIVSLAMIVKDKQGDIAILRAMGTSESQIRRVFIVQGGLIGLFGCIAGLLSGIGFTLIAPELVVWFEQISGFKLFNADIYPVNYLPVQISFVDCLVVSIVAILLCLLASVFPAISAAKVRPAEALRFE